MKSILFITGTRADYGKIKSLILELQKSRRFKTQLMITGMHNLQKYGNTRAEMFKDRIKNCYVFIFNCLTYEFGNNSIIIFFHVISVKIKRSYDFYCLVSIILKQIAYCFTKPFAFIVARSIANRRYITIISLFCWNICRIRVSINFT